MASESDRREKLLSLNNTVRAFFESTTVGPRQKGHPWASAFRGVRTNDYMAESFLEELQALLDYIEAAFATAPAQPEMKGFGDASDNDDRTSVAPPRPQPARPSLTKEREAIRPDPRGETAPSLRPPPSRTSPPSTRPQPPTAPPPPRSEAPAPRLAPPPPRAVAPPPGARPAPSRPVAPPPRAAVAPPPARSNPPAALRSTAPGMGRPSAPSTPEPARPRPAAPRRNQFVDVETTVTSAPEFSSDDRTGPTTLPTDSTRRRR